MGRRNLDLDKHPIWFRPTKELRQVIEAAARDEGRDVTDIVRRSLIEFFTTKGKMAPPTAAPAPPRKK